MRSRHWALALFALLCAAAVSVPALGGDRIQPTVLGLPFSLAWNAGWVGLSFGSLLLFHILDGGERPEEEA